MNNNDIIDIAKNVIKKEEEALAYLRDNFPYGFAEAAQYLSNELKGKIVVTSMGKSGYVARRFAATLVSTGTKAVYLHSAEASHGDMGIIDDEDCVIALSNSGETAEMNNIISYTRRFKIKLIALCSNPDSTLGKNADINVTIPKAEEVCVIGKAPSTSIILLSAMVNAFVVLLEHARGLTPDMYKNWHPGGKLGASLLKVSDLMHTGSELPLLSEDSPMADVLDVMGRKVRFGCVGAVDKAGRLSGIFTDGDIRRRLADGIDIMKKSLKEAMGLSPKTVSPDSLAPSALLAMNEKKIQALFAVDGDGKPVGIISFHDLLAAGVK
jgi:arabinose-5-phosphate isomerase